jgi:tyrosyl-tRNA synthetase
MSKESVKKRIETGISFTEFSYQILQAYDFLHLFENHNCSLQMGGSDQWGNITSGTELIRRNHGSDKAFALTSHLLTKADGQKFGKSEAGNIWLDPKMTSPYRFYQFWLRADDRDLEKFLKTFSLESRDEIQKKVDLIESDPNAVKRSLAEELTTRIHSKEDCKAAINVSELMFNKKLRADSLKEMTVSELEMVAKELPSSKVKREHLANGCKLIDLMTDVTEFSNSKSEIRRAVKGNAVSVNKEKVKDAEIIIQTNQLLHNRFLLIENGKKNKFVVDVVL